MPGILRDIGRLIVYHRKGLAIRSRGGPIAERSEEVAGWQGWWTSLRGQKPEQRKQFIVDVFAEGFGDLIRADPDAWRGKFRKMAATPFAFYRGSAALFYADMAHDDDPFLDEQTSRVWIQGDLHAENFGTYMNSAGVLVFDVNDFDEAYVGPFTWDLKRLAASLALLGYQKALSDDEIRQMIETVTRSYVDQVARFASGQQTRRLRPDPGEHRRARCST